MSSVEIFFDRDRRWNFYLLAIALIGVVIVLCFTRFGPGVSGDSVYYAMGGQNIANGNGYSRTSGGGEIKPITGFPPFFSFVLSTFAFFGANVFTAGRIFNALLFAANIFLVGYLIYRYSRSVWAAIFGAVLVLSSDTLIENHGWIMSEPLYVFLTLLAMYFLAVFLEKSRRMDWILAIIFVVLAMLTRFVGVALVAAAATAILLLSKKHWKQRILDSVAFGVLSAIPLFLWMYRNSAIAGTTTNREWIFHPMRPELATQYLAELSSWFSPGQLPIPAEIRAILSISIVLILPAIVLYRDYKEGIFDREKEPEPLGTLPWILSAYIVFYLAVILLNSFFLDAGTTPAAPPRYFLPIYVAMVILFVLIAYRLVDGYPSSRALKYFVLAYGLMLLLVNASLSLPMIRYPLPSIGYTGLKQQWPDVVAQLNDIDPSAPIISNNPEMIYVFTERPAYMRPIFFDVYKLTNREDYSEQLGWVQSLLDRGGVYVQLRAPSQEDRDAIEDLNIEVRYAFPTAWIYVAR
jgi:hypothetical protein